jgi:hypothetical protein
MWAIPPAVLIWLLLKTLGSAKIHPSGYRSLKDRPMANLLIESYQVASLGGYSTARQLFLKVKPIDQEEPAQEIILLSFKEMNPPKPSVVKGGSLFQILMPLRDFDDIYRILQTEKPLYLEVETSRFDVKLRIGTWDEPLGEGPEDISD